MKQIRFFTILLAFAACTSGKISEEKVTPVIITDRTPNDTDDPAIWKIVPILKKA